MSRKNILKWVALATVGVLASLALAAVLIVRTDAFRRFVLQKIAQQAYESTGARLEIANLVIHWRNLSVDFYDMKLHGTEPAADPPLLVANHLKVGLKIVSLLQRKVNFDEFVLDRPVAVVRVDDQGNSNFPKAPVARSSDAPANNTADIFDLGIEHVAVNSGVLYYNDRQTPLSAEVHDFQANVGFNNLTRKYKASLAYAQGRLAFKDSRTIEHDVQVQLTADKAGLTVDQFTLRTGASHLTVRGELTNYANPAIQATYDGVLRTGELAQIMDAASLPAGEVALAGSLRYQAAREYSFMDAVYVDGTISSPVLLIRAGEGSAEAEIAARELSRGKRRPARSKPGRRNSGRAARGKFSDAAPRR